MAGTRCEKRGTSTFGSARGKILAGLFAVFAAWKFSPDLHRYLRMRRM